MSVLSGYLCGAVRELVSLYFTIGNKIHTFLILNVHSGDQCTSDGCNPL